MLVAMHVPKVYWCDAGLIAAYLINRMSLMTLNFITPLELLLGVFPILSLLGCLAAPAIPAMFQTSLLQSTNYTLELSNVYSLGILLHRKGISATIYLLGSFLEVWIIVTWFILLP